VDVFVCVGLKPEGCCIRAVN